MNWVGGARSRVKAKDTKKKQREFFERRRFQNQVSGMNCNNRQNTNVDVTAKTMNLSQDVIFLRTLMNQNKNSANKKSPQVVHVNLDRPRPSGIRNLLANQGCLTTTQVEFPKSPQIKSSMTLFHSPGRFVDIPVDANQTAGVDVEEKSTIGTPPAQIIPSEYSRRHYPETPMTPTHLTPYPAFKTPTKPPSTSVRTPKADVSMETPSIIALRSPLIQTIPSEYLLSPGTPIMPTDLTPYPPLRTRTMDNIANPSTPMMDVANKTLASIRAWRTPPMQKIPSDYHALGSQTPIEWTPHPPFKTLKMDRIETSTSMKPRCIHDFRLQPGILDLASLRSERRDYYGNDDDIQDVDEVVLVQQPLKYSMQDPMMAADMTPCGTFKTPRMASEEPTTTSESDDESMGNADSSDFQTLVAIAYSHSEEKADDQMETMRLPYMTSGNLQHSFKVTKKRAFDDLLVADAETQTEELKKHSFGTQTD